MTRLTLLRQRLGIAPAAAAIELYPREVRNLTEIFTAEATVPTASGSRYLQQLCKHWSHNLTVEFTPDHGTVMFPKDARGADHPGDARITLDARGDALAVRIDATSIEQRDGLKPVVARHLDRFAFREAPLAFDWHDL